MALTRMCLCVASWDVCVVLRGGFAMDVCDAIDDGAIHGLRLVVIVGVRFDRIRGVDSYSFHCFSRPVALLQKGNLIQAFKSSKDQRANKPAR